MALKVVISDSRKCVCLRRAAIAPRALFLCRVEAFPYALKRYSCLAPRLRGLEGWVGADREPAQSAVEAENVTTSAPFAVMRSASPGSEASKYSMRPCVGGCARSTNKSVSFFLGMARRDRVTPG